MTVDRIAELLKCDDVESRLALVREELLTPFVAERRDEAFADVARLRRQAKELSELLPHNAERYAAELELAIREVARDFQRCLYLEP